MERALTLFVKLLPVLFAFGFVVPVIMQTMTTLGWRAPFGLSALAFALLVGGGWGIIAQVRGRWV